MTYINILDYIYLFLIDKRILMKMLYLLGMVGSFSTRPICIISPEETPDTTSLPTSICCTWAQVLIPHSRSSSAGPVVSSSVFNVGADQSKFLVCCSRQQVELLFGPGGVPPAAPPAAGDLLELLLWSGLLLLPAHFHLRLFQQSLHFTGV